MKKIKRETMVAVLLILISVSIYSVLVVWVNELEYMERDVIVELSEKEVFPKDVSWNSSLLFTGKGGKAQITECYLGKEVSGNIRYTYGNLHLFLPDMYHMNLGESEDQCVLSSSISRKLFGTEDSSGMRIQCEGKEYVVAGVTEYSLYTDEEIILGTSVSKDFLYDRVGYRRQEHMTVKMAEQYLQNQYGIDGKIMDLQSVIHIIKGILAVYVFVVGGFVLAMLRSLSDKNMKRICMAMVIVMTLVMFIKQCGISIEEFPSRWSDTEAWGAYWTQRTGAVKQFLNIRTQCMCRDFIKTFFKTLIGLCLAIPCLVNRYVVELLK